MNGGAVVVLRDRTITLVGFCGVAEEAIRSVRSVFSGAASVGAMGGFSYGDGNRVQSWLVFPAIDGEELRLGSATGVAISVPVGRDHKCEVPNPVGVRFVSCGLATVFEWQTSLKLTAKNVQGAYVDVETRSDGSGDSERDDTLGVLGARMESDGMVVRLALIEFGDGVEPKRRRVRLTGVYNYVTEAMWSGRIESPPIVAA